MGVRIIVHFSFFSKPVDLRFMRGVCFVLLLSLKWHFMVQNNCTGTMADTLCVESDRMWLHSRLKPLTWTLTFTFLELFLGLSVHSCSFFNVCPFRWHPSTKERSVHLVPLVESTIVLSVLCSWPCCCCHTYTQSLSFFFQIKWDTVVLYYLFCFLSVAGDFCLCLCAHHHRHT